jgi:hypothetical protein
MSEKIAPVQGFSAGIPWSMHLRAYDAYCKEYGPQSALIDLEGRNCRGGFSTGELDSFGPGWREELSEIRRLEAERDTEHRHLEELATEAIGICSVLGIVDATQPLTGPQVISAMRDALGEVKRIKAQVQRLSAPVSAEEADGWGSPDGDFSTCDINSIIRSRLAALPAKEKE